MFDSPENQSEQNARIVINTMRKALGRGDLTSAARRLNRIRELAEDRSIERGTFGELLLTGAEVARACGRAETAAELTAKILYGTGGLSNEIFGRAKRLHARTLLDDGKIEEARALAETADRYVMTGLIEEKIESRAGREYRVNVPLPEKFLDQGEHVSFETYFLLAEIAALQNDWSAAAHYVERARDKYTGGSLIFPELEFWQGILQMARGESFMETVEPALTNGNPTAVLVGRVEALLNQPYRSDSAINESEYARYQTISRLARTAAFSESPTNFFAEADVPVDVSVSASDDAADETARSLTTGNRFSNVIPGFVPHDWTMEADLSRMAMLRLNEVCDDECVTGLIVLKWNEAAVREGIDGHLLHAAALCGAGMIYCRDGQFVDAALSVETADPQLAALPQSERAKFYLKQMLLIALGGGSTVLAQIQSRQLSRNALKELPLVPEIYGLLQPEESVAGREDVLQIASKINFILDVSRELDEFRNGYVEEQEIDWDADWGAPAPESAPPSGAATEPPPPPMPTTGDSVPRVADAAASPDVVSLLLDVIGQNTQVMNQLNDRLAQPLLVRPELVVPVEDSQTPNGYSATDSEIAFGGKFGKTGPIERLTANENQAFTGIVECYWLPEPLADDIRHGSLPAEAASGNGFLFVNHGRIIDATFARHEVDPKFAGDEADARRVVVAIVQIAYSIGVNSGSGGYLKAFHADEVLQRTPRMNMAALEIAKILAQVEKKTKPPIHAEDIVLELD